MTGGSAVEAVVFDWGGTLTPWHTVDAHAIWLAYANAYSADADAAATLARRLNAAEQTCTSTPASATVGLDRWMSSGGRESWGWR